MPSRNTATDVSACGSCGCSEDLEACLDAIGQPVVAGRDLAGYRGVGDDYYEADRFAEFCDRHLARVEECMREHS
jgi:hypothetical protein